LLSFWHWEAAKTMLLLLLILSTCIPKRCLNLWYCFHAFHAFHAFNGCDLWAYICNYSC
jgi:hypothetical protein